GSDLAASAKGISEIDGDYLRVTIPDWLADKLGIREGTVVDVHNTGGKFNILPAEHPPTT
ncbi:MAG TPA: AbrB/MazE/SpoVT family DNA-binding domain-containing protein, partial [Micropepsaceae bacterium]|nr:AbrB/MazE/SpoVT family DNA-binding domain-containing protein [Micropepsaceae bacterium]